MISSARSIFLFALLTTVFLPAVRGQVVTREEFNKLQMEVSRLAENRCESGKVRFLPNGQPKQPNGSRVHSQHVTFSEPFATVPVVTAGLSMFDMDKDYNLKLSVKTENITKEGFDLAAKTWYKSTVFYAAVRWMACSH